MCKERATTGFRSKSCRVLPAPLCRSHPKWTIGGITRLFEFASAPAGRRPSASHLTREPLQLPFDLVAHLEAALGVPRWAWRTLGRGWGRYRVQAYRTNSAERGSRSRAGGGTSSCINARSAATRPLMRLQPSCSGGCGLAVVAQHMPPIPVPASGRVLRNFCDMARL